MGTGKSPGMRTGREPLCGLFPLTSVARCKNTLFFKSLIEFPQQIGHHLGIEFVRSLFGDHTPRPGWLGWRIA